MSKTSVNLRNRPSLLKGWRVSNKLTVAALPASQLALIILAVITSDKSTLVLSLATLIPTIGIMKWDLLDRRVDRRLRLTSSNTSYLARPSSSHQSTTSRTVDPS
jgi:hypothetical protein